MENKKTGTTDPPTPSSMFPNAGSRPSTPPRRRRYLSSSRAVYDLESSDETPEATSEPLNRTNIVISPEIPTFPSRRLWGSLYPSSSAARGPSGSSTSATADEDTSQVFKTLRNRVVYVTPAKKRRVSVIEEPNQETEPQQETGSEPEMAGEPQVLVKTEPESPRVTVPELDPETQPESEADSETDPAPAPESDSVSPPATTPSPEKESQPQPVPVSSDNNDSDGSSIILTADSKAPAEVIDLTLDSD